MGQTGGGHARYWDGCSERRRRGRVRGPVNAGPGVAGNTHGDMADSVTGPQPDDEHWPLNVFVGFLGEPPTSMMVTADTTGGQLLSRRAAKDGPTAEANLAKQPNVLYLTCNGHKVEPLDTVGKHCPGGGCFFRVNVRVCGGAGCETDAEVETVAQLRTRVRGMKELAMRDLGKPALVDICTRLGAKVLTKMTVAELIATARTTAQGAQLVSRYFQPGGTKRPHADEPQDAANADLPVILPSAVKKQATMSSFGTPAAFESSQPPTRDKVPYTHTVAHARARVRPQYTHPHTQQHATTARARTHGHANTHTTAHSSTKRKPRPPRRPCRASLTSQTMR